MLTYWKIVGLFLRLNLTLLHSRCRALISVDSVDIVFSVPKCIWIFSHVAKVDMYIKPLLTSVDGC